jgi:hypothetical protein
MRCCIQVLLARPIMPPQLLLFCSVCLSLVLTLLLLLPLLLLAIPLLPVRALSSFVCRCACSHQALLLLMTLVLANCLSNCCQRFTLPQLAELRWFVQGTLQLL